MIGLIQEETKQSVGRYTISELGLSDTMQFAPNV